MTDNTFSSKIQKSWITTMNMYDMYINGASVKKISHYYKVRKIAVYNRFKKFNLYIHPTYIANKLSMTKDRIERMRLSHIGKEPWNKGLTIGYKQRKYNFDKQVISDMIEKRCTLKEISKEMNCSVCAVYTFCKKNNINIYSNIEQHRLEKSREKSRLHRMSQKFNNKDTYIEKKVESVLVNNHINFEKQKKIMGITEVDFFINPNICIYCDGDYWHNLDYVKKRDERINNTLKENNYLVLRYSENNINNNLDLVENTIKMVVG